MRNEVLDRDHLVLAAARGDLRPFAAAGGSRSGIARAVAFAAERGAGLFAATVPWLAFFAADTLDGAVRGETCAAGAFLPAVFTTALFAAATFFAGAFFVGCLLGTASPAALAVRREGLFGVGTFSVFARPAAALADAAFTAAFSPVAAFKAGGPGLSATFFAGCLVGDAAVRAGLADRVGAVVTFSEGAFLVVRLFTGSTS
jgi:hypothetical protein